MKPFIRKLLIVVMFLLFILAIIHILDIKEGYPSSPSPSSGNTKYNPTNTDIQYHATAEDLQKQLDTDTDEATINMVDGGSGKIVQIPISKTMSDTTYYDSGTLKYNPINYVPNYEDTIYFSKLTGLGYQTPTVNYDYQLSGFCQYDRYFPEQTEEKCNKLDADTCASTSCCVLLGSKCMAGNVDGPIFKAHYSDIDIKNKDKYFYMGRCYGNCVDDQSNYAKYDNLATKPVYLPTTGDYLDATVPKKISPTKTPKASS